MPASALGPRASINVSIIILGWTQGRIVHHTLKSIGRAVNSAQDSNLTCEIVVVANKPGKRSYEYLATLPTELKNLNVKVLHTNLSSDGQILNFAISTIRGRYVSIIKSGDLMNENWISEAVTILKRSRQQAIIHPQYSFWYGQKDRLWEIRSSTDKDFISESMIEFDSFTDIMMTTSKIAKDNPFSDSAEYSWAWNAATLSKSINHLIAPGTLYAKHFIESTRHRPLCILPKLDLFQPMDRQHVIKPQPTAEQYDGRLNKSLLWARTKLERLYGSYTSKLVRKNSRVDMYLTSLLNETRHLLRPIIKQDAKIPSWVEDELRELHKIDLRVFPTEYLRYNIEIYRPAPSSYTFAYWGMVESIGNQLDILFLVPYLKNGGAEREIANQTNAVLKLRPSRKIKILSTEPSGSPGASLINKRIDFIEAGSNFYALDLDQQAQLLTTLIVQLAPKKVHLVNSTAGYTALQGFSKVVAETSKIFITIFMIDKTPEGRDTHKFTECMSDAIDNVQRVYTDNHAVVERLVELMGISRKKFQVLYQPVNLKNINADERFKTKMTRILWAGRLDRQKRPDILAKIAKQVCRNMTRSVEFHVYGSSELADFNYQEAFKSVPGLHYHGPYEGGLYSLDLGKYDIFLMTSEWEGYPNVLLEAISGGLLPIVPKVGGIPELIKDSKTGYLVEPYDDIDSYEKAIRKSISDNTLSNLLVRQAQAAVKQRHGQQSYEQTIKSLKEYLD